MRGSQEVNGMQVRGKRQSKERGGRREEREGGEARVSRGGGGARRTRRKGGGRVPLSQPFLYSFCGPGSLYTLGH